MILRYLLPQSVACASLFALSLAVAAPAEPAAPSLADAANAGAANAGSLAGEPDAVASPAGETADPPIGAASGDAGEAADGAGATSSDVAETADPPAGAASGDAAETADPPIDGTTGDAAEAADGVGATSGDTDIGEAADGTDAASGRAGEADVHAVDISADDGADPPVSDSADTETAQTPVPVGEPDATASPAGETADPPIDGTTGDVAETADPPTDAASGRAGEADVHAVDISADDGADPPVSDSADTETAQTPVPIGEPDATASPAGETADPPIDGTSGDTDIGEAADGVGATSGDVAETADPPIDGTSGDVAETADPPIDGTSGDVAETADPPAGAASGRAGEADVHAVDISTDDDAGAGIADDNEKTTSTDTLTLPGKPGDPGVVKPSGQVGSGTPGRASIGKPPHDPDTPALSGLMSCAHICDQRLEPVIGFWVAVFSRIHSRQGYVHDARYPERIFATVNIPERRKNFVRKTIRDWRAKLRALANTQPESYTPGQRRLASLYTGYDSARLAREIRASAGRLRIQVGQANYFRAGIARSGRYRQQITEILRRHGVPGMVVALPLIESAYNNAALSHVGAAGMWQFMRETARRYITVNRIVDERKDPLVAAEAAAKLLKNNYDLAGSWPLAITAYNHGVAGMLRARKQLGTDDIYTIIHEYNGRRFRFASRNFFVELLAAWEVFRHPLKYFPGIRIDEERTVQRLSLTRGYLSAQNLAKILKVDLNTLRRANPHYARSVWSGDMYFPVNARIILPDLVDAAAAGAAVRRSAPGLWAGKQKPQRFHTIRYGETLSTIAAYYGISQSRLAAINNVRGHRIYAGRKLILPHAAAQLSQGELDRLRAQLNPQPRPSRREAQTAATGKRAGEAQASAKPASLIEKWLAQVESNEISSEEFLRLLRSRNGESTPTGAGGTAGNDADTGTNEAPPAGDGSGGDELRLLADPSDYLVDKDGYLITLYDETLGHYADWLGVPTQNLRRLNGLRYGRALRVGQRLRLDFSRIDADTFYHRRLTWHLLQQDGFFSQYQIASVIQYRAQRGDSIWKIVHRQDISPPLWLVQQLNPSLNMSALGYGQTIRLPILRSAR